MFKKVLIGIIVCIIFLVIYFEIDLNKNKIDFYPVDIQIEENSFNKVSVDNANSLVKALEDDKINIIEITKDLDLGYNRIDYKGSIIDKHNEPLIHPILKESGVSKLKIKNKDNLIIYSKNGSKLLDVNIRIVNSKNIRIDNLKMEELWEWDEESKAAYSINDWDYITIQNSENIQISNMEFSKCYDGITDIKDSKNVTIEYCKVKELNKDDYFFNEQFIELENNMDKYPMYKYLRKEVGLSINNIKELSRFQYKVYLIQPQKKDGKNENIVIHDSMYLNVKTRIPTARNSSVYLYNIYFDGSKINYNLLDEKDFDKIKKVYPKVVALSTYGPIALDRSYIVINNCFFNVKHLYTTYYNLRWSNHGKIVIQKEYTNSYELKSELEKLSGNKIYL